MADAKGVVGAFTAPREGGKTAFLAQAGHLFAAPGEDLVRVGLVADIPQQAIVRGVVDVMQGNGQLDYAQAGTKMAAGLAHAPQQEGPQLVGQLAQLALVQGAQLRGVLKTVQQRRCRALWRNVVESGGHQTRL